MDPTNALNASTPPAASPPTPADRVPSPEPLPLATGHRESGAAAHPQPPAYPRAPAYSEAPNPPAPAHSPPPTQAPGPAQNGTPGPAHATAANHSLVASGGDQCPSCGFHVASDQRYCLHCGARCGEPRLPFMNAVTFMNSLKQPAAGSSPPPKRKQRRVSPNAALIASVGTLLLAMGVGVLIGRSGNHSTAAAPAAAPIVIKGGSGSGEEAVATTASEGKGAAGGTKATKQSKKALAKEAKSQSDTNKVLNTNSHVKLAPPEQKLGGTCEKGTAGCSKSGKFEGNFFGGE